MGDTPNGRGKLGSIPVLLRRQWSLRENSESLRSPQREVKYWGVYECAREGSGASRRARKGQGSPKGQGKVGELFIVLGKAVQSPRESVKDEGAPEGKVKFGEPLSVPGKLEEPLAECLVAGHAGSEMERGPESP